MVGRSRPDAAEDPNSDPLLKWSRIPAGQSYQGWVTFTVPYGPTEVYFTILGERLAIFPAPISETRHCLNQLRRSAAPRLPRGESPAARQACLQVLGSTGHSARQQPC